MELDQGERAKHCQDSGMCSWIYTLELRLDLPHNLAGDCRLVTITSAESILLFCIIQTSTVCTTSSKVHGIGSQMPLPLRIVLELGFSSVRLNFIYIVLLCRGLDISLHCRGRHTLDVVDMRPEPQWCVDFLGCCDRPLASAVGSSTL